MATIERRGPNSWRIGVQLPSAAGVNSRRWVRRTITLPPGLSASEQQRQLGIEAMRLEVDVADGRATPSQPYGPDTPPTTRAATPQPPRQTPPACHNGVPTVSAPICPGDTTIQQLYDIWMQDHVRVHCKPKTISDYEYIMQRMLPDLGPMRVNDCTPAFLTHYMAQIAREPRRANRRGVNPDVPVSARTLAHYYDTLSYMLSECVRMQLIYYNPIALVRKPRAPRRRPTAISDEQAVALLRELTETAQPMLIIAVMLALICGLRLGEVCALTTADIEWRRGRVRISRNLVYIPNTGAILQTPKTDDSIRTIDIPNDLMELLRELRRSQEQAARILGRRWRGDGRLITSWDGTPVNHDTPSRWWRRWADQHGYQGVRYHDLRHTHACILLSSGIDVASVAARMGHSTPETTLRYYADAIAPRDNASADIMQTIMDSALPPDPPQT